MRKRKGNAQNVISSLIFPDPPKTKMPAFGEKVGIGYFLGEFYLFFAK